jgi:DNA-binding NtrC family response regulator
MSTPSRSPGALPGLKVLVVDDDYFIADETRRTLATDGAEVVGPVASVEAALALIAAAPGIDAAVLDVNLRDVMVYPVADALIERGVPFVFATGYEPSAIPARYADVLRCEKPVEPDTLARALSAQVDDHG